MIRNIEENYDECDDRSEGNKGYERGKNGKCCKHLGFREGLLKRLGCSNKQFEKLLRKTKISKRNYKNIRDYIKNWIDKRYEFDMVKIELKGYLNEMLEFVQKLNERSFRDVDGGMKHNHDLDILRNRINKTTDDVVGCAKVYREMCRGGCGWNGGDEYEYMEEDIPKEFICPITLDVMNDPVICSDGHTYERSSVETLFDFDRPKSPITREYLDKWMVVPNYNLKKLIDDFMKQQIFLPNIM